MKWILQKNFCKIRKILSVLLYCLKLPRTTRRHGNFSVLIIGWENKKKYKRTRNPASIEWKINQNSKTGIYCMEKFRKPLYRGISSGFAMHLIKNSGRRACSKVIDNFPAGCFFFSLFPSSSFFFCHGASATAEKLARSSVSPIIGARKIAPSIEGG